MVFPFYVFEFRFGETGAAPAFSVDRDRTAGLKLTRDGEEMGCGGDSPFPTNPTEPLGPKGDVFDLVIIDVFKDASGFLVSCPNELSANLVADIEPAGFENPRDDCEAIAEIGVGASSVPEAEMNGAGSEFLPKFF